jgi:hypothetical protein
VLARVITGLTGKSTIDGFIRQMQISRCQRRLRHIRASLTTVAGHAELNRPTSIGELDNLADTLGGKLSDAFIVLDAVR